MRRLMICRALTTACAVAGMTTGKTPGPLAELTDRHRARSSAKRASLEIE
jgi:hypothetical protein